MGTSTEDVTRIRKQGNPILRIVCARGYWTGLYAHGKEVGPVHAVVYCKRVLFGQTGSGESRGCAWRLLLLCLIDFHEHS